MWSDAISAIVVFFDKEVAGQKRNIARDGVSGQSLDRRVQGEGHFLVKVLRDESPERWVSGEGHS